MSNSIISDPHKLIEKLLLLQSLGYIFRGHANAIWRPIPSVFRLSGQKALSENYPIKYDTYNWYFSSEIKKIIELWAKIRFENIIPQGLKRIFDLYTFIIKYNFGLYKFHNENPDSAYVCEEMPLIMQRDWASEQTFIDFVGNTLQSWLNIYNLDGSLRHGAKPFEELTIIEEPFPQHYGFFTAALDFSKNPLKALYFALLKNFSTHFTIIAYNQVEKINSPTKIIENKNPKNIRAIRQEGCFVYFTQPCSFYVYKNKFPSLVDYDRNFEYGSSNRYFKMERIIVPKSPELISILTGVLAEEDINKHSLAL